MKKIITMEIDIPEGHEFVRVGTVEKGEHYLDPRNHARVLMANADLTNTIYFVVKIKE